jgi:hypothetical protein
MHFVNLTGHSDTAYFEPILMKDTHVRVKGNLRSAMATRSRESFSVKNDAGFAEFPLPALDEYELVELA